MVRSILHTGLALFLLVAVLPASQAANPYLDSLQARWDQVTGEARIEVLAEIMRELCELNSSVSLDYFQEAEALLDGHADPDIENRITLYAGISCLTGRKYNTLAALTEKLDAPPNSAEKQTYGQLLQAIKLQIDGTNDSAQVRLAEVLPWFRQEGDSLMLALIYRFQANIQMETGHQPTADSLFTLSLTISRLIRHDGSLAGTLLDQGRSHSELGHYSEALVNYSMALDLYERAGNAVSVNFIHYYIGNMYARRGEYEDALVAFNKAAEGFKVADNGRALGFVIASIAGIYKELGEVSEARSYYEESIRILEELGDQASAANSYLNLGGIYTESGNFALALQQLQKALQINREIEDPVGLAGTFLGLSEYYDAVDSLPLAIAYSDSGLQIAQSINYLILENMLYERQVKYFEQTGAFERALEAHKLFKATNDSLFSRDKESIVLEIQEQFKTKEQKQRIELLEKEQSIQRLWLWSLITGLIGLAVIAGLVYNRYLIKTRSHLALNRAYDQLRQTQDQLIQSEKMASLGLMTAGIAHELKNPLNFIQNFSQYAHDIAGEIQDLANGQREALGQEVWDDMTNLLTMMQESTGSIVKNGRRANDIISGMMEHTRTTSRAERRKLPLNPFVQEHTKLACNGFLARGHTLDIQVEVDLSSALPLAMVQPQELGRVIINLVTNACDAVMTKAEKSGEAYLPQIKVQTAVEGDQIQISIRDNGIGIPEDIISQVFNPFFTTKPTGAGNTGLGLSISYDIIHHGHQGTISVQSEVNEFTEFIIQIPVAKES